MIGRTMPRKLIDSVVVSLLVSGAVMGTSLAQKMSVPKQPNVLIPAREKVIEILMMMPTHTNGKISKQEWMKFMEAEFDSLDREKKGDLDLKGLQLSPPSANHVSFASLGK